MKSSPPHASLSRELAELRVRLAEAEETVRGVRNGEVDAVVITGRHGPQVFTLQGAEHAYRVLIESMNEGALTLTAGAVILYANQCFADMVKGPLERVIGRSFRSYLSAADRTALRPLLKQGDASGSKIQVLLRADDGSQVPAQISVRPLERTGHARTAIGMVVTDVSEPRRTEERLRALARRVLRVQESERGRLALELHDNITQSLCAILFHSQALENTLAARNGPEKRQAAALREMLGVTAQEVERLSRSLRPSVLDQLGLSAALRHAVAEFAARTGVPVKLDCPPLAERPPGHVELALYRLFQEALENVERHAHARHVSVSLKRQGTRLRLLIRDDGVGFDPSLPPTGDGGPDALGLLSMRESATYAGGILKVKSASHAGTEIDVRLPLAGIRPVAASTGRT